MFSNAGDVGVTCLGFGYVPNGGVGVPGASSTGAMLTPVRVSQGTYQYDFNRPIDWTKATVVINDLRGSLAPATPSITRTTTPAGNGRLQISFLTAVEVFIDCANSVTVFRIHDN